MRLDNALNQLKRLTVAEKTDFSTPGNYFLDLSEKPTLLNLSKPLIQTLNHYRPLLNPIVTYYGQHVGLSFLKLARIKKHHFVHGSGVMTNGIIVVLYFFEDIQTGLAMVPSGYQRVDFFRLTAFTDIKDVSLKKAIIPPPSNTHYH